MRKTRENIEKNETCKCCDCKMSSFKEQIKSKSAITLVALVVTIVVLILLAGVSINLVMRNNGIMQKAKEAKESMKQAAKEEQEGLSALEKKLNSLNTANAYY